MPRRQDPITPAEWLLLLGIVLICTSISCLYGHWVYGDWTCGLPSVHCRKNY